MADAKVKLSPVSEDSESLKSIEATLNQVDRALERLRLGTYRTCEVCGSTIDQNVLEADPVCATCMAILVSVDRARK
jgi:RNA polymerase-binding transcription factor DksA